MQREWHDPARTKSSRTWLFAGAKAATVAARARIMAGRRMVLRSQCFLEKKKGAGFAWNVRRSPRARILVPGAG